MGKPFSFLNLYIFLCLSVFNLNVYAAAGGGVALTCPVGQVLQAQRNGSRQATQICVPAPNTGRGSAPASAYTPPPTTNSTGNKPSSSVSKPRTAASKSASTTTEQIPGTDGKMSTTVTCEQRAIHTGESCDLLDGIDTSGNSDEQLSDAQQCDRSGGLAFINGQCKYESDFLISPECKIIGGGYGSTSIPEGMERVTNPVTYTESLSDGKTYQRTIENGQFCPKGTANKVNNSCDEQFKQYMNSCNQDAQTAANQCNDENETMKAAQDSAKAIGVGSAANIALACSKLAEVATVANTALTAWQGYCAKSQSDCEDNCTLALQTLEKNCITPENKKNWSENYAASLAKNKDQCGNYKVKIREAAEHLAAAAAQNLSAKQCESITKNSNSTGNEYCAKNPNDALCTQSCSNPTFAAANKVCICQTNPTSQECLTAKSNAGGSTVGGGTIKGIGGSGNVNSNSANPFGNPGSNVNSNDPNSPFGKPGSASGSSNQAQNNLSGNQGGSAAGGGAGAGSHSGGAAGGAGAKGFAGGDSGDKLKINSGFYGANSNGMGGPNSGFYGRNTAGVGGLGNGLGSNSPGGVKFDPRRYIAGLDGIKEFIKGPNDNIFKVIKVRYEAQKPSLLSP